MEQKRLRVKKGKKYISSKPWDFEAMCLVDDAKRENAGGGLRAGLGAVYYLFEGTEITDTELSAIAPGVMMRLCLDVMRWYAEEMQSALKNG